MYTQVAQKNNSLQMNTSCGNVEDLQNEKSKINTIGQSCVSIEILNKLCLNKKWLNVFKKFQPAFSAVFFHEPDGSIPRPSVFNARFCLCAV